jgi:hypothetical protein
MERCAGLPARHAAGRAPGQQHVDQIGGRVVAEQLALVLFVKGDAVSLHQRDEVLRGVARQCRAAEVRVGADEVFVRLRTSMSRLVKLARPPPEMRIFSATLSLWSSSSTFSPRWPATPAQNRPAAPAPTITTSSNSIHGAAVYAGQPQAPRQSGGGSGGAPLEVVRARPRCRAPRRPPRSPTGCPAPRAHGGVQLRPAW